MRNLSVSEVENWLLSETDRLLSPLRKKAKDIVENTAEHLKRIRKEIDSINKDINKLLKEGKLDKACKVASTFSEKLLELLNNFEVPENFDYRSLSKFKVTLDKFLRAVWELGSKYIPRMSIPTFKTPILRIDYYIKGLYKIRKKLNNFLETKYSYVKHIEETIEEARKILEEENKIRELQKEIREKNIRIKELQKIKNRLEEEINEKRDILKTEDFEEKAYKVRNEIRNLLAPIDKALRKFLNLVERGEVKVTKEQKELLSRTNRLKNPTMSLKDTEILKELLESIKGLILSGKISLDKKKSKKALNSIQMILEKHVLDELTKSYVSLRETKRKLEEEHKDDLRDMENLEEELRKIKTKINDLEKEINEKEREINDSKEKIFTLKEDLERRIEKIVNEPVKIDISSLS